jgi:enoyl-CoA hydratase/carnithine racemase
VTKVLYKKNNGVAYITLNRPHKYNAIDRDMNQLLNEIWLDFKKDEDVFVAIVNGQGDHFCAGFDLGAFMGEIEQSQYEWCKSAMFGKMRGTPNENEVFKPIITVCKGTVNGMGTLLMLEGDIRITSKQTYIGLGEARLNFPVEFSAFITRLMPLSIASEMLYTAKPINAKRLYDIGIINHIVPENMLMNTAEKIAKDICKCGCKSIQVMKELVIKGQYMDYNNAVYLTSILSVPVVNSEETKNSIRKFLNRKEDNSKE